MKRIILGVLAIALVTIVAVGATIAQLSDTETSVGNTLSAGTIDLKVDNQDDPLLVHITRTNLVPGPNWTTQYGGQWVIRNAGTIPGTVSVKILNVKDWENTCIEPEVGAGDVTCGVGDDQGELGAGLINRVYWSLNQPPWGSLVPMYPSLQAAEGNAVTGALYHLNPGESKNAYLYLTWDFSVNDNRGQGDSVEFDVEFTLTQD